MGKSLDEVGLMLGSAAGQHKSKCSAMADAAGLGCLGYPIFELASSYSELKSSTAN